MRLLRLTIAPFGLITALGAPISAEKSADSVTVRDMAPMVVTATRREADPRTTPGIAFVLNRSDIDKVKASRSSEVLEYVPGLDIECGTGVGAPFKKNVAINGLPSFHNVVLVDGKRLLSSHFHTGANIDMVPAGNIERIEVIKDASSSMYGSDALGGVINIITKKGSAASRLDYEFSGGSRSTLRSGLSLSGRTAENILHSAFASWDQSDGIPLVEGRRKDQLEFKQLTVMDKIDVFAGDAGRVGASIHYSRLFDMPLSNIPLDAWLFTPGADFDIPLGEQLSINGLTYYSQWYAEQATGQSPEKSEIASPSLWVTWSGLQSNVVTAGGEYVWRNFMRQGVLENDQHHGGVFLQDEITLPHHLKILGSVRVDYVKNTAEGAEDNGPWVSPRASLLYRPFEELGIRAGAGTGFRAPHVQDLYESRYHSSGGGIWRYGNSGLKPESSRSINAGADWDAPKGFTVRSNGYFNRLTDMIALARGTRDSSGVKVYRDTVTIVNGKQTKAPIWERVNVHDYTIGGIEGALSYTMKYAGLELGASGVWHRSDDPKAGDALQYPGRKVYGNLSGRAPIGPELSCNGFVGVQRVFNRHASTGGGTLADYTNLEAGVGLVLKGKYEIFFKGRNLLREQIQMYEDALWTIEGIPLFEGGIKVSAF